MALVSEDFALLSNATATGAACQWPGGPGVMEVVGTFSGATVALQVLGPDGATYIPGGPVASAAGSYPFNLPPGFIKGVIVGSPTGIYARVATVDGGLTGAATGAAAGAGDASEGTLAAVSATLGAAAASAAADTGASTVNGFMRKLRDIFVGAYKTAAAAFGTTGLGIMGSDGTNARAVLTDTAGRQLVAGAAASGAAVAGNPVLSGGSDGTNAQPLAVDTSGRQMVVGPIAHDAVASGFPVQIGFQARVGGWTGVVANDVIAATATRDGALLVRPYAMPGDTWSYAAAAGGILNTTTAVTIKASTATMRNHVQSIQVMAEALGAATELAIRDGAAGTVLWRIKIPAAGLPATNFSLEGVRGTASTLLEVVTLTASVTGAVYVNAQGYTAQ